MARLADPVVRQRWEERMRSFEECGLSVVDFCRQEGVSSPSFYQWRKKLRSATEPRRKTAVRGESEVAGSFVPLVVGAARECFRIHFPDCAVVEIPICESSTLLGAVERLAAANFDRESQP
jgi:hypothetical protein